MSTRVPIGECVDTCRTWNPHSNPDICFTYIDIASVSRETKMIEGVSTIAGADAPSRARQIVQADDVLVSTVRPNLNAVAQVPHDLDGATASTGFTVLRPTQKLDSRYLFHWVTSPLFVADMIRKATGASYPAVSDWIVKDSLIPLPPLPEQRRIAAILDKADALRAKRRLAIAKLDQLLQSVFLEMFGDPVTNPKGWKTESIGALCSLVRGSSPRPKGDPRYFGGSVPRLMVADLTRDGWMVTPKIDSLTELGATHSRPVPKGTVVMAVSGNVGLAAILQIDACIHDGFVAYMDLDEQRINPIYFLALLHLMKSVHTKATTGAIFKNTTTTDIKKIQIPLPPIPAQQRYEQIVFEIQTQQTQFMQSDRRIEAMLGSLQQDVFV